MKHVAEAAAIFKEHGATRVLEAWGSDVPDGALTSYPLAVRCEPHETVATGFIEWPSKAAHDAAMPGVMAEMESRMRSGAMSEPPYDGKRLIFGAFEVVFDESA